MTAKAARPPAPTDLGKDGMALWGRLMDSYEFEVWELVVVELACKQRDVLALLEDAIRKDGIVSEGSQGQPRLSQLVGEARQTRLALSRLLGGLKMPTDSATGDRALTDSGRRAQRAAQARWAGHARLPRGKSAGHGDSA